MIDFINIVFRFFDFFVVIGLVVYLIKYYLVPGIEKLIREYNVFIYNLESDSKNLQLQIQSILENIQDQEQHFDSIQKKFLIWQDKCDNLINIRKEEQEKINNNMKNRYDLRSYYMQNNNALKEQLPSIIDEVTTQLQLKFHTTAIQKKYIDELIQVMKVKS